MRGGWCAHVCVCGWVFVRTAVCMCARACGWGWLADKDSLEALAVASCDIGNLDLAIEYLKAMRHEGLCPSRE
jgi:pentatricopeptide repeat protein